MNSYCYFESPIGRLTLSGRDGLLQELRFPRSLQQDAAEKNEQYNDDHFQDVVHQLSEYFQGTRKSFELQLRPAGTDFPEPGTRLYDTRDACGASPRSIPQQARR